MTLEILKTKEELRKLIDDYAYFTDAKNISDQVKLFTTDVVYAVRMDGMEIPALTGRDNMEKQFTEHAAAVKTYFTLNGQHTVNIDGDSATGVSYSIMKMIREADGKLNITDYSVKYEDKYVLEEGKWLISERIAYFVMVEARALNN